MNGVAMDRNGLILWENEATGSRKVFRYLPGLRDTIKISKNVAKVWKFKNTRFYRIIITILSGCNISNAYRITSKIRSSMACPLPHCTPRGSLEHQALPGPCTVARRAVPPRCTCVWLQCTCTAGTARPSRPCCTCGGGWRTCAGS